MTHSRFRGLCVCIAAMSLASCQDEDFGYTTSEIKSAKYAKDFRNFFGDIDPEQDWNIATRGTVTVTAAPGSEIKVYAKMDGTYKIVGDYENFSGNETLNFDMLEETTDILVTNGTQSAFAKVGESVYLSGTRTAYTGGTANVSVASQYTDLDAAKYVGAVVSATDGALPEEVANLGKVTQNFSYISNGAFTIHPVYWNTSSAHILGVYWKNGDSYSYQDIYKDKEGNELTKKIITESQCYHNFNTPEIGAYCSWHNHYYNGDPAELQGSHEFPVSYKVGDICPTCGEIVRIGSWGDKYCVTGVNYSTSYLGGNESPKDGIIGSKAITVSLPVGTQFGFYLKVFDNTGNYYHTVYSSGALNAVKKGDFFDTSSFPTSGHCVVRTDGKNTEGSNAFAATFQHDVDGNTVQYLCFEDWSYGITDLNDLVFAIPVDAGTPPAVVDEDAQEWVICGEDLGGTFDLDYNDVVVSIAHVSGKTTADFTALAAGGTLASYVYFNGTCLGEIHELLGAQNANSGNYDPINVSGSVGRTAQRTLTVASNFSIATVEGAMDANMGGFQIRVVPAGQASTEDNAVGGQVIQNKWVNTNQNVPYVFCVPRYWTESGVKKSFRWPNELVPVDQYNGKAGAYNQNNGHNFGQWTEHRNKNQWFKSPVNDLTTGF